MANLCPLPHRRLRPADRGGAAPPAGRRSDFTRQPTDLTRYHSSQAPVAENNYRGNNRNRYRSAEFDALIDRYLVTIPRRERVEILGQMVRHITENLVVMGMFHLVDPALISNRSNRLVNVGPRKNDEARYTWNAQEWELR